MVAALLGAHGEGLDLVAFTDDARDVGAAEGQNSFFSSRCIAFVMRRRNLLVFALAFLLNFFLGHIVSEVQRHVGNEESHECERVSKCYYHKKGCEADALAVRWFNLIRELPLKITSF